MSREDDQLLFPSGSGSGFHDDANMSDQCTSERLPAGTTVELVAYGFIYPILTLVIIFTNVNGIIVLLRMKNFTQTNMLLLSIFIVDLLTTVFPFPKFLIQFTFGLNRPQTPFYPWCYLSSLLFPVLPIITNNVSIWFVVALTVQRFTCVWKRDFYDLWFNRKNVASAILVIAITTSLFHSVLFIENYREALSCSSNVPGLSFSICNEDPSTLIIPAGSRLEYYIFSTYYLSRIVVFHLIPILAIAISNLLLIRILMKAEGTRRRLFSHVQLEPKTQTTLIQIEEEDDRRSAVDEADNKKANMELSKNNQLKPGIYKASPNSRHPSYTQLAMQAVTNGMSRMSSNASTVRKSSSVNIAAKGNEKNKAQRISSTTHMLMAISTIYLFQHICQSVLFVSGVALNLMGAPEPELIYRSITIQNLIYWAGFPANFLLCLHVQAPFREAFFSMYRDLSVIRQFCKFCLSVRRPLGRPSSTGAAERTEIKRPIEKTNHAPDSVESFPMLMQTPSPQKQLDSAQIIDSLKSITPVIDDASRLVHSDEDQDDEDSKKPPKASSEECTDHALSTNGPASNSNTD